MVFVALDLETTGLDKKKDAIIEVALVKFDEKTFRIIDTYTTLVNPGILIPQLNANITNISDEMVVDAPTFESIIPEIESFISDSVLVGHNVFFDTGFLMEKGVNIQHLPCIDTFFLANTLLSDKPSISLDSLCGIFGIDLKNAHRALDDTLATVKVLSCLIEKLQNIHQEQKSIFEYLFSLSGDIHIQALANYIFPQKKNISFEYIKKSILERVGTYQEPKICYNPEYCSQDTQEIFSSLESRKNQKQLLENIQTGLQKGGVYTIEAATGIGKTLSYILPAMQYALQTGQQVCVSTKTKILQDQIYFYEAQKALKIFGHPLVIQKFKGQQNYISLFNLFKFTNTTSHDYESLSFLSKIYFWLYQTIDGEIDVLNLYGNEFQYVRFVYCDMTTATSTLNPYREYEFLYKARKNLDYANIIITNHAAFFSDIYSHKELQSVSTFIFDEAHSIEDIATQALKRQYSAKQLNNLLTELTTHLAASNLYNEFLQLKDVVTDNAIQLDAYITENCGGNAAISEQKQMLVSDNFLTPQIHRIGIELSQNIQKLVDILRGQVGYGNFTFLLTDISNMLSSFFSVDEQDENIRTISYSSYFGRTLESTLLNIDTYCEKNIWRKFRTCFLLSATLKIAQSFEYIQKSLGLPESTQFSSYESDFDYSQQAQLIILKDIGSVKNNFQNIIGVLKILIEKRAGHMLVLFTSFQSVKTAFFELNEFVRSMGGSILAQGISGSKYRILEKFQQFPEQYIVFGTDSFWEGIDLPGSTLEQLVIHKFPFMVPTDPIFIARSKKYQDAFGEYAIPKAILKLKQGMGRLIRTREDTGTIYLLDDRIYSTQWGKQFYAAFPKDITIVEKSIHQIK